LTPQLNPLRSSLHEFNGVKLMIEGQGKIKPQRREVREGCFLGFVVILEEGSRISIQQALTGGKKHAAGNREVLKLAILWSGFLPFPVPGPHTDFLIRSGVH